MSQLNIDLPNSLHQTLNNVAHYEGSSVNQYIVYALSIHVAKAYVAKPVRDSFVSNQEKSFNNLLEGLGKESIENVRSILNERVDDIPEKELTPEILDNLKKKIYSTNCNITKECSKNKFPN